MSNLTISISDTVSIELLNKNEGHISLILDNYKKKDIEKRLDLFCLEKFMILLLLIELV